MIRKTLIVSLVVAASAFAAPPVLERAPTLPSNFTMQCEEGSTWAGQYGLKHGFIGCVDAQGQMQGKTFYIYADGSIQDIGLMDHGNRTGVWKHFDRQGNKIGETTFVNDRFEGKRVTFHANGQIRTIDNWNQGALVGVRQYFDMNGNMATSFATADTTK
jgi:hypothetical protein